METQSITVKGVDQKVYTEFRSRAVGLGKSTGEALTEAMRMWLKNTEAK